MWELLAPEERIKRAITEFRKSKKRPTMQGIFERINKKLDGDEETLGISLFKDGMGTLEDQGLIYDGGDEGNESWFISDKKRRVRRKGTDGKSN